MLLYSHDIYVDIYSYSPVYYRSLFLMHMNTYDYTDGIVGDVLFWSLRKCIGHEYDFTTHRAWVRIFSAMLKVRIMPLFNNLIPFIFYILYICNCYMYI